MIEASILFITYQHEEFVAEAIKSALSQDYPDLEIVICDDASNDRTLEILRSELRYCPSHINVVESHSRQNVGLHYNFNRGLSLCSGEVVIAMSGDDVSLPGRVSAVVREFETNKDTMVVVHNWQLIDKDGRDIKGESCKHTKAKRYSYGEVLKCIYARSPVCGATAAYRRVLFDLFGEMLKGDHGEDNCFWFRGLLLGKVKYLPEKMVKWRSHETNLSNWSSEQDCPESRCKHLKWLKRHNFIPQYSKDIETAVEKGVINPSRAHDLLQLVIEDYESKRLRRYSLTAAPWKLWIGSAIRLRKCSRGTKFYRKIITYYLKLKVFKSYRERKYWSKRFG